MSLSDRVRAAITTALERAADAGELGDASAARAALSTVTPGVERPKRAEHGDLATNVAMVLTKKVGKPPRAIAEALVKALAGGDVIRAAEIAGPGFVNLRLHPRALHDELVAILHAGVGYGRAPSGIGERIDLEFVSANPTGPINVASGRNAIYGDAVARLLEATGHRVTREYYINDFGNQIRKFSESVRAVAEGRDVGEDGYHGKYVEELATWLKMTDPETLSGDPAHLSRTCTMWMLRGIPDSRELPGIRRSLADIGVEFDVWFSEDSLHRWGAVPAVLQQLQAAGHLTPKDGALFFVGKDAADDKDRVVRKSNGEYTYFASEIAYLADKVSRGYDRLITVLGVDHHGYLPRVKNALEALGLESDKFEALLYALVFIYKGGQLVKSSKRAGNFVTCEEVAEEIDEAAGFKGAGRDALRFFFLSRSTNSNVEFDIDLAKKKSLENPVFYVQYGHARLSSILRKARELGVEPSASLSETVWAKLAHEDELAIAHKISDLPDVIADAARTREPHKIVFFVNELANAFQSYFTRLKTDPILPPASVQAKDGWRATWDMDKTRARVAWIEAVRIAYGASLALLGVSAPERMDKPEGQQDDDETRGAPQAT
jgi:arginyl-tRNA synthetase